MYLVFTLIQEDVRLVEFIYPVFTRIQKDVRLMEFIYPVFTRIQEDVDDELMLNVLRCHLTY